MPPKIMCIPGEFPELNPKRISRSIGCCPDYPDDGIIVIASSSASFTKPSDNGKNLLYRCIPLVTSCLKLYTGKSSISMFFFNNVIVKLRLAIISRHLI